MSEQEPFGETEFREMYRLRVDIGDQTRRHRARYGNKDGIAADGERRRYDDPIWQEVETYLDEAQRAIYKATERIRERRREIADDKAVVRREAKTRGT